MISSNLLMQKCVRLHLLQPIEKHRLLNLYAVYQAGIDYKQVLFQSREPDTFLADTIVSGTGCQICDNKDELPFSGIIFTTHDDLFETTVGKNRTGKKGAIAVFLRAMNALLNQGSGEVIVHADKLELLNFFDEQVDDKLQKMVTDETCFTDNFERITYDEKHIVFRVIPKHRRLSTLVANTTLSLDRGKAVPSQAQLRNLGDCASEEQEDAPVNNRDTLILENGQQVFVANSKRRVPFQESRNMQAKRMVRNDAVGNKVEQFTEDCWKTLCLAEYISAFSKLQGGGSVYLGLKEEKIDGEKEWREMEEREYKDRLRVNGPRWKVWKNDNACCVAEESDVPVQTVQTGKVICEGVSLSEDERRLLSEGIKTRVEKEMLWLSRFPSPFPVKVLFHEIRGAPDNTHRVVEVKVDKYHGLSFFTSEGPEAYKPSTATAGIQPAAANPVRRINVDDWLKLVHKDNRPTLKKYEHPFH